MNVLARNRRTIYLCKHYREGNIIKFSEPKEIKINIMPVSVYAQTNPYGKYYGIDLVAKTTPNIMEEFNAGDKCYIDVEKPSVHDILCKQADYIVDKIPSDSINVGEVRFKRLSNASNVE